MLEMQNGSAFNEALSVYGGEAKVDADEFAGAAEFKNTGNAKGLANAAMSGNFILQPGDKFRNGIEYHRDIYYKDWEVNDADQARAKATSLDLNSEELTRFLRDEQEQLLKEDKAWVDARVTRKLNDWMCFLRFLFRHVLMP